MRRIRRREALDGTSLFRRGPTRLAEGYCHPARFNDLAKNGKVPQELLDKLPPAESYSAAKFPSLEEQAAAKEIITKQWDTIVGANVAK
jgi:putative spermidine/putrescine transport system substrate-binding protein